MQRADYVDLIKSGLRGPAESAEFHLGRPVLLSGRLGRRPVGYSEHAIEILGRIIIVIVNCNNGLRALVALRSPPSLALIRFYRPGPGRAPTDKRRAGRAHLASRAADQGRTGDARP